MQKSLKHLVLSERVPLDEEDQDEMSEADLGCRKLIAAMIVMGIKDYLYFLLWKYHNHRAWTGSKKNEPWLKASTYWIRDRRKYSLRWYCDLGGYDYPTILEYIDWVYEQKDNEGVLRTLVDKFNSID